MILNKILPISGIGTKLPENPKKGEGFILNNNLVYFNGKKWKPSAMPLKNNDGILMDNKIYVFNDLDRKLIHIANVGD
jgi:hypothetical protein